MYRELKVALSGQMEIEIGDESKRMFNPGDILQVEDFTGQGHTTRSVGERISASVALSVYGVGATRGLGQFSGR